MVCDFLVHQNRCTSQCTPRGIHSTHRLAAIHHICILVVSSSSHWTMAISFNTMRLCQHHEAESFRFAAYGSYVNTYAPAGLRVSGSFISSGSTKMSQERWFQKFLVFTSNWGRLPLSWAIWHIFQCWNHQNVRSLKLQKVHLARDESRRDRRLRGLFCSRKTAEFCGLFGAESST